MGSSLKPGRGHLLLSRTPKRAFALAEELAKQGAEVRVVSRFHPERLAAEHAIPADHVIWLTTNPGADHLTPGRPALITDHLCKLIADNPHGVLVFHGFEYLVTMNDFANALRVLEQVAERAAAVGGMFVVTVDPRAFSQRELALLESFLHLIEEDTQPAAPAGQSP